VTFASPVTYYALTEKLRARGFSDRDFGLRGKLREREAGATRTIRSVA
jgi:hypothetical protein